MMFQTVNNHQEQEECVFDFCILSWGHGARALYVRAIFVPRGQTAWAWSRDIGVSDGSIQHRGFA